MTEAARASLKKTVGAARRWAPVTVLLDGHEPGRAGRKQARVLRLAWLAAALAAAWLVPLALHVIGLDVVVFGVLLVAVASVLRSGTVLLDRLILAAGLLAGVVCAAGLVFSVWPWRLAPVPVGGTLLSAVAVTGWAARRKPRLPLRLLGSDALVAGSGLFAFWAAVAPIAGLSSAERVVLASITTDRLDHFALFDTVRRIGGYPFLHPAATRAALPDPTATVYGFSFSSSYPTGSHFLYALFDTFLKPATQPVPALPEYNRYFIYVLTAYAFCVMAAVWSARWIAGPAQAGWRRGVVCAAVAGLALGGPLIELVVLGQDSEIVGLAMLALAVAVAARPPRGRYEHAVLAGALLIAVCYTYSLYAVIAGAAIAAGAAVYRSRLRNGWPFNAIIMAVACGIALVPLVIALRSGFNANGLFLTRGGWMVAVPGPVMAALTLLIAATMAYPPARRLPGWRAMCLQLAAAAAVTALVAGYQVHASGRTGYYFAKILMADYVICLAGAGALGTFLRAVPARAGPARSHSRCPPLLRECPVAAAVAAAVLILAVGFPASLRPTIGNPVSWTNTPLSAWDGRQDQHPAEPSLAVLARASLLGDGIPTVVLSGGAGQERYGSYLAAVLNGDLGEMWAPLQTMLTVFPARNARGERLLWQERREVRATVAASQVPLRVIVGTAADAANARAALAANPRLNAEVVVLPGLRG